MKILAVDDDHIALRLLGEALENAGYTDVHTCTSGAQAYEILLNERVPFDCFLLDIKMPGMNGIDLCKEIRSVRQYQRTPILMVTALSEKTYVDRAFSAGATDYLTKPFDPTEVAVRLGLAHELNTERKFLAESTTVIESLIEELDRSTRHDLDDAIDLGKLDRVLGYPSFENYLYQSGRNVFFLCSLFAVKIRDVAEIHEKLPPLEFKDFLRQVAREIVQRLDHQEVFLSYRGEGEFIGVLPQNGVRALKALGDMLTIPVEESDGKFVGSVPREATLVIGDPVANRLLRRPGSLKDLLSAIDNARNKSEFLRTALPNEPTGKFANGDFKSMRLEEQRREDELRAEFEALLKDKLKSDLGEDPRRVCRNKEAVPSTAYRGLFKRKPTSSGHGKPAYND